MTTVQRVYLDNAATTRVAPEVFDAMRPFLEEAYGNPSALYSYGQEAARAVSRSREQVASLLHADANEIFFTSGATESNNWALTSALQSTKRRGIVTSAIEHHAVLEAAKALTAAPWHAELTVLPVDREGRVAPEHLAAAVNDKTAIISIMLANNEIGTLQPIRELASIAHECGALFHTDAVQGVGKIPVDVQELQIDLLSLSGHKFHGPKGIGALYVRKGTRLPALLHGGGQQSGLRPGLIRFRESSGWANRSDAPGQASRVVMPAEAMVILARALRICPEIRVVGIAGPGDPLASAHAVETLTLVHEQYPQLLPCLSTNGLELLPRLPGILAAGVRNLTVGRCELCLLDR